MLVTFRFKNFGPFKEEAVLDMRAVKAYKEHPDNLITAYNDLPLLKVAAIYGANASGKSQFVDAYYAFSRIVLYSFAKNNKEDDLPLLDEFYNPFFLDSDSAEDFIEFEGTYRLDNYEYRYGFCFNSEIISYEWLYRTSLKSNRQSVILERDPSGITLGSSVRKSCEKYIPEIDSDVLALSLFSSLKLKTTVFGDTMYCIKDILPVYLSVDASAHSFLNRYFERDFSESEKGNLLTFLKAIDIGISDIFVEKKGKNTAVYTRHLGADGNVYEFPLEVESDGTRRAIALYSLIRTASLYDKALLFDEFHSQLHPLLQKYILDLFYEQSKAGQIIYTTHDTTLLDKRFTRRDQVWFTSKNEAGESTLYSLSEFNIRNDRSFDKDYLSGIYGGIPNLKDFSFEGGIVNGEE